ncbi:MAG: GNAT family N-acetyltransferase [SAR324 cluster bacterium]|nr:GNAT family N-acetyltransferase [SAR324 cluster bacterium]
MELLRTIEEASLNAWPPLRQMLLDGWLLRFSDGFTRRANSVHALYAGQMDAEHKVGLCEEMYAGHPLGCVFRITPLAQPPGLDELLARRGYVREAETSVRVLEALPEEARGPGELALEDGADGDWPALFGSMNGVAERHLPILRGILGNISAQKTFATLRVDGRAVACGLGVRERESVGLFDIVTEPAERRKGYSRRLIAGLLAHAAAQGARRAYLQVMLDNAAALTLYDQLGFRELYRYWYRMGP